MPQKNCLLIHAVCLFTCMFLCMCSLSAHTSNQENIHNFEHVETNLKQLTESFKGLDASQRWAMYEAFKLSSDSLWAHTSGDASRTTSAHYYFTMGSITLKDPTSSVHSVKSYMDRLEEICTHIDKIHAQLIYNAYLRLAQIYLVDGSSDEAFQRLEAVTQLILKNEGVQSLKHLPKEFKSKSFLQRALIKELLCYKAIPDSIAQRNRQYLKGWDDYRKPLALALIAKDNEAVIHLCNDMLLQKDLKLTNRIFLMQVKLDILSNMPFSTKNAEQMMRLVDLQDSIFKDINRTKAGDYTAQALLQQHETELSDLNLEKKKALTLFLHYACGLVFVVLVILAHFYRSYRKRITFRHQLFENMRLARSERRKALRDMRLSFKKQVDLVHNLNHEIRGSLNALIGFSNIIASSQSLSQEEKQEANEVILDSSQRLTSLVNNVLDIARFESHKMTSSMNYIQVKDLFDKGYWDNLRMEIHPSHQLELELHESESIVHTDKNLLIKIVQLLVTNAKQVSSTGENITLSLYRRQSNHVEIQVSTSTCNMPYQDVLLAMDHKKGMNDYDNSQSYYLVLARMLAQLIEADMSVDFNQSEGLDVQLLLPIINK